jgi:hypothetical protein
MHTQQWRNCWKWYFLCSPCRGHIRGHWNVFGSLSGIDSWSWRLAVGSHSSPGASTWRKYRLKPEVRVWGWHEMITTLQGREPGSRGTNIHRWKQLPGNMTEDTSLWLEVLDLVAVQFPRDPEVGEKLGCQNGCHCRCLLASGHFVKSMGFRRCQLYLLHFGKCPAMSVAILSNSAPTLCWCLEHQVQGTLLAAEVSFLAQLSVLLL